ncbi:MAG: AAA family ATPase [Rhizorhabdus sp.]|uniref:AAA family ATPase n=1 Tax=Rhizorhabdus sp. TaxID=1968843 RepID=UPI001B7ADC7C|nr:AAA family ATPase [Rhizorhabdus sp.]MBP8231550.1 AAA family ATPase [Rhizorhabdus sp.]
MMDDKVMSGVELREIRGSKDQQQFADLLNRQFDRKYDRATISRWESGAARIPQMISSALRAQSAGSVKGIPAVSDRPGLVMACVNQKGGVGKTTSVVNIAYLLATSGLRVLVVDCDPQANASIHLGVDVNERERAKLTLTHALFGSGAMVDSILHIDAGAGMIDILPSHISLANADAEILAEPNGTLLLREKLGECRTAYDVILLDCPPNMGQLTVSSLNAADLVLIPSQTEVLSFMGLTMLMETISKVQRRVNPKLKVLGILPTSHQPRRQQDKKILEELTELAAVSRCRLFSPVRNSAGYPKGALAGKPAIQLDPDIAGIEAYREVVAALVAALPQQEGSKHVA